VKDRGLIVREWVDQRRVLGHRTIGGFLSHCGWNSVLEGLSEGVPILAWPMWAEQSLNSLLVVEGFSAGLRLRQGDHHGILGRKMISDGVRSLMGGKQAEPVRERAQALGRAATRAVQDGGSSQETLTRLIHTLVAAQN